MPLSTLSVDTWGPCGWSTLHFFAHASPELDTAAARLRWRSFLYTFAALMPCPKCARHFTRLLDERMPAAGPSTRAELISFLNDAHNDVNRRRGKRVYSLSEHYRAMDRRARPAARRERAAGLAVAVAALACAAVLVGARPRRARD